MKQRTLLVAVTTLVLLALPLTAFAADDLAVVEKNLTPANLAKLEAGEVILLDQTYTDAEGKTRGKGLAIVLIDKPPEEVWKYIPQFDSYKEFMPRMVASKIYLNEAGKIGAEYTLKVAFKTIVYSCMHYLENDKFMLRWELDAARKNDIASTTGWWKIKPYKGKSIVAYTVAVDTGIAVPKVIQDYLTKRDLPNVVRAMKKRVESGGTYQKK